MERSGGRESLVEGQCLSYAGKGMGKCMEENECVVTDGTIWRI